MRRAAAIRLTLAAAAGLGLPECLAVRPVTDSTVARPGFHLPVGPSHPCVRPANGRAHQFVFHLTRHGHGRASINLYPPPYVPYVPAPPPLTWRVLAVSDRTAIPQR
jgi:hypothetical protein